MTEKPCKLIKFAIVVSFFITLISYAQTGQQSSQQPNRNCAPGTTCNSSGLPESTTPRMPDDLQRRLPSSPEDIQVPPDVITSPERTEDKVRVPARTPGDRQTERTREPRENYTDFQKFVAASVGRMLPIYGHNLFQNVPSTFAPVDRIPVTSDYVIGPGDEILIRGWGQIQMDVRATVDRNGAVFIPKVGNVNVAGLKYDQLQGYLKSEVGRMFQNFELSATLGQLRSIQIFVVGQANRPGSYTVSSLSSLVNAVFASGGPLPNGSMRRIQLKRNSKVVTEFDLYDLLLKGDKSKDAILQAGDVVYIPAVGEQISVAGSVNVPAIYELKGNTTLEDSIAMAGGLTTTAEGQKATVERIENRTIRRIETFPLDAEGNKRPLRDGDIVTIYSLSPRFENAVTLRGNVAQPGRYPWRKEMRVADLIPSREFLITRDYWSNQNLISEQAQHEGARADENVLRNDVKRNAPEINWDYAVIQRLSYDDLSTRLLPFNLAKAILDHDDESNLLLQPGDIVTIFSQTDLMVPIAKQSRFVRFEGEFQAAGIYQAELGETLRGLTARTGGVTKNAYLFGAEFTRESTRIDQQKRLDSFLDTMERDINRTATTAGQNASGPEDTALLQQKVEGQRRLLTNMRQVKATGRIVLGIKPGDTNIDALPDLILEDGDKLIVPNRSDTINVMGSVYNENAYIYEPGRHVSDYLRKAGGARRDADQSRMFVIRADASVVGYSGSSRFWTGGIESLRLMPGDTIVVPVRLDRTSFMRGLRDWTQIISQFAIGAAAIKVIGP